MKDTLDVGVLKLEIGDSSIFDIAEQRFAPAGEIESAVVERVIKIINKFRVVSIPQIVDCVTVAVEISFEPEIFAPETAGVLLGVIVVYVLHADGIP